MKSKACNLKSDVETTKMQAMNKYNRGGIEKKQTKHNRVRELEAT